MRSNGKEMIEIRQITKRYGAEKILDQLDLSVGRGETIVLIGPSGTGKSTVLRCINGLERFESGIIQIDGMVVPSLSAEKRGFSKTIREVRQRVGMVFQSFNLFPHLTVLENLTLAPRRVLGRKAEVVQNESMELLARVNLKGKEFAYPRSLSGGEQQRVAIARALAMRPEAILFDEPTSSLDPELVSEVLAVISDLAADGYTMLIVTHQMDFARRSASRVAFLDGGKVVEEGPPEQLLLNPRTPRLRSFLSKVSGSPPFGSTVRPMTDSSNV